MPEDNKTIPHRTSNKSPAFSDFLRGFEVRCMNAVRMWSEMFWDALKCPVMLWDALDCSVMFCECLSDVLGCVLKAALMQC